VWQGLPGGTGYTHLTFGVGGGTLSDAVQNACDKSRTFFDAVKSFLPVSVTVTISPDVPRFNGETGALLGVEAPASPPTAVVCTGVGPWTAPAGASIIWFTSTLRGQRLMRGRTYLVPFVTAAYQADGTLATATKDAVQTAGASLRTAGTVPHVVWGLKSAKLGAGVVAACTGEQVRDKIAILRSRRD
jgi:hypothetical protein